MSEEDKRLTEAEYQAIKARVEKDWPVRCKLAELCGFKASPRNPRALKDTEFDLAIHQLYLEVMFRCPENADEALALIRTVRYVHIPSGNKST